MTNRIAFRVSYWWAMDETMTIIIITLRGFNQWCPIRLLCVQYLSQTNFHNNLSWIAVVLCRQFSKSFAINWEWEREWARKKGVKAVKSEVNWLENLWKIDNIFELTSGRVHGLKIITEMRRASAPLIHHLHTLAVRCAIKLPFNPVSITPVYTCSKQ